MNNKNVNFSIQPAGIFDFTNVYQWLGEKAVYITAKQGPGPIQCYYFEDSGEIKQALSIRKMLFLCVLLKIKVKKQYIHTIIR